MTFPTGWGRKCAVTIDADEVDATLTNFPFLLTPDNLPSEMFDADGSNPALSGGGDIRFSSDADGDTQLACEVVNFVIDNDPANGEAEIWVNVASISASVDTTIYVWYNKSGETQPAVTDTYGRNNVWDANYLGVYHAQNESSAATCVDSTGNGNTGTVDADDGPSQGPFGNDDGAWGMDGNDDVPVGAILDGLDAFTIEQWIYSNSATAQDDETGWGARAQNACRFDATGFEGGASNVYLWWLTTDSGGDIYISAENSTAQQAWGHVVCKWADGDAQEMRIDGAADTPSNSPAAVSGSVDETSDLRWGNLTAVSGGIDGFVDECRLSDIKRADAWTDAGHSNQVAPGTFASAGTPEDASSSGTTLDERRFPRGVKRGVKRGVA